jgi:hypothetical protein
MVMKRFALAFLVSTGACAAPLATLPPNDSYVIMEGDLPGLSSDERKLFDAINTEFVRLGLPRATLGSYEQNAAAIMANVALARLWRGSGRAIAQQDAQEIAPPVSGQEGKAQGKHEVASGRLSSLTDEEDDTQIKHVHFGQHLIAHGIPPNVRGYVLQTTYAQMSLDDDQIKTVVRSIRPPVVQGQLRLGVAILPVGDADARLFVVTMRDQQFDLTKGPQRFGAPGSTFEVAGTAYGASQNSLKLGLLGPDGKVQLAEARADLQGNFSTSMTIPNAPGLYTFSASLHPGAQETISVPIFAGIAPTPWPVSADPKETPIDGTRTLVQKLAKAIAEWRHSHGIAAVPIDAALSAFAKSEATVLAKAVDESSGDNSGTPLAEAQLHSGDRLKAAGLEPRSTSSWYAILPPDYVNDWFARFPGSAFEAALLSSPTARKVGVGVVLVPNTVTKDTDIVRYLQVFVFDDPTPPSAESPHPTERSETKQLTVAIRADGTMSVNGAQADEARLKQAIDTAKSVNPDLEVILQVEEGAKTDFVQHVTEVIKAEGVVSIISPPPATPAPTPAPGPAEAPKATPPPGN